jgi:hypothetical protein
LLIVLAVLLVVAGLILLPLPIPLGIPFLVLAAGLLSALFPGVRRFLERWAHRHPRYLGWLERFLHRVRERYPDDPSDRHSP